MKILLFCLQNSGFIWYFVALRKRFDLKPCDYGFQFAIEARGHIDIWTTVVFQIVFEAFKHTCPTLYYTWTSLEPRNLLPIPRFKNGVEHISAQINSN